jgi:plastocyanin
MKATIYVIVILIIIVFGYFWLSNMNTATAPAPATDQTSNSAVETSAPADSSSTTTTVTTSANGQPTTKTVTNTTVSTKPAGAVKVSAAINNFSFVPQILTINAGDTVVWTNNDSTAHTVTADAGAFNSPTIGNGGSFSFTFNTAGTYRYHCSIHPSMTGQVVVK